MRMQVRDKSFKIDLVNNYVHELYSEMAGLSFDLSDVSSDVEEVKTRAEFKELRLGYKLIAKQIVELRDQIIKELLESNGYNYDSTWWKRKTSVNDLNEFVLACVKKDESTIEKKATEKK